MTVKLQVKIITPANILLSQEADIVTMPGEDGEFGVLPLHAPLVANLKVGLIKVVNSGIEQKYFTYNGIARISENNVDIITEFSLNINEIRKETISEKIKLLDDKVAKHADGNEGFKQESVKLQSLLLYL